MSDLIVVGYNGEHRAEEVRLQLIKMERNDLTDLEDAAIAVRDQKGHLKLHQISILTAVKAISGGFWGALIGLMLLNPLIGGAIGVAAGSVVGALGDVGLSEEFMKHVAATLKPGGSALFVLVRKGTSDKVIEQLQGTGGKILRTSLTHDDEAKLQAALDAARSSAP